MNYPITKENYSQFIDYLYLNQDLKYRDFHQKLIKTDKLIGVKTPILKKIAKNIAINDGLNFFRIVKHTTYEECVIHGLVVGYLKTDFKTILKELDRFLPYNTNWAINDLTVANLKIFKQYQQEGYQYIEKLLKQDNKRIRFGLVLFLTYYLNDLYIDQVINWTLKIASNDYYVKMANAWLISMIYIKYQDKIKPYLLNGKYDMDTTKKAIQKIKDSYRIDKTEKVILNDYLKSIRQANT